MTTTSIPSDNPGTELGNEIVDKVDKEVDQNIQSDWGNYATDMMETGRFTIGIQRAFAKIDLWLNTDLAFIQKMDSIAKKISGQ